MAACTKSSFLKTATVVVGIVDVGLTSAVYHSVFTEIPFLIAIICAMIISFGWLVLMMLDKIPDRIFMKRFETIFHFLLGLLLFMASSVFFSSVVGVSCDGDGCTSWMFKRYFAALLGFVNAVLYAMVGWGLLDVKIVSNYSSAGI